MIEGSFDAQTLAYMNVAPGLRTLPARRTTRRSRARRAGHNPMRKKRQDRARSPHRGWGTRFGTYPGETQKNPRKYAVLTLNRRRSADAKLFEGEVGFVPDRERPSPRPR